MDSTTTSLANESQESSDDRAVEPDGVAQTTNPPVAAVTTSEAPTTTAEPISEQPSASDQSTTKDPAAIIVTLDDLPTGWSSSPPDDEEDEDDASAASCLDTLFPDEEADLFQADDVPSADATFQQSEFGPFLGAAVATGVPDARGVFDDLGERFASCDGTTDDDGYTLSILPVSFAALGDDTFAVRIDAENPEGFPLSIVMALARVEDVVIISFSAAVMGPADAQLVEDITRTMVGRA